MKSEDYIQQVNRLMDLQNTYLVIFLTILSVVITVAVVLQWRMSESQMKKMKDSTKAELIEKYRLEKINSEINENNINIKKTKALVLYNENYFVTFMSDVVSSGELGVISSISILEELFNKYYKKTGQGDASFDVITNSFLRLLMKENLYYIKSKLDYSENRSEEIKYIPENELSIIKSFFIKIKEELGESETLNRLNEYIVDLEKYQREG